MLVSVNTLLNHILLLFGSIKGAIPLMFNNLLVVLITGASSISVFVEDVFLFF
ncbi:hypothetical protein D515_04898 [Grimontia indica]|uniref:Uncharacterized protein n=1 Tax=Grimontia indica TaxID=1056512 RepID=R1GY00_9GAMM|nr:hypothetical protein D515_04898 [Grimontia indica]